MLARVEGFFINGITAAGDFLYWGNDRGIWRWAPDSGDPTLLIPTTDFVLNVAATGHYLYWTEFEGIIRRANIDGSGAADFITDVDEPAGIALTDTHVYWSEASLRDEKVRRARLDGTNIETIFTGLSIPDHIFVRDQSLYWSDLGTGKIQRSGLDGSNVVDVVSDIAPEGIAVTGDFVYWADWGSHSIGRARLDGTEVERKLVTLDHAPYGIAVISGGPVAPRIALVAETVRRDGGALEIDFRVEGSLPSNGAFALRQSPSPGEVSWSDVPEASYMLEELAPSREYRITVPNPPGSRNYYTVELSP
jgi:hypothetical protein